MPPQHPLTGLEVETVGDVTVARFTRRSFLSSDQVAVLSEQMVALVDESGCRKFVLNFANVESMTTAMVGHIVQLQRKIEASGGRLLLCNIDPFLFEIFKILNLTRVFTIHPDEPSALASF
jgi:anti-sigma B factor antagonist